MDKPALRYHLRQKLGVLDDTTLQIKSRAACENAIRAIDWSTVHSVSCYQFKASFREVDPAALLEYLRSLPHPPEVDFMSQEATFAASSKQYDVVIVPLLGYDSGRNRLGRGSGWYDRFLSTQSYARSLGLGFSDQQVETIPSEPHDVRLDIVCDETTIYQ